MTHRGHTAKGFGRKARATAVGAARPTHAPRGFTAIEIAMVATVIAILALIVLPLFRNRVEEAKKARAQADLVSLMKAETLAQADTTHYFRLNDLDNVQMNIPSGLTPTAPTNGIDYQVPGFYFRTPSGSGVDAYAANRIGLTIQQWTQLAGSKDIPIFRGPYIAFQDAITYADFMNSPNSLVMARSRTSDLRSPIWNIPQGDARAPGGLFDAATDRIPVDPWGNPYLFFPATGETGFENNAIYSLGPNGLPGDGLKTGGYSYLDYIRNTVPSSSNSLGNGDDLSVQF